MGKTFAENGYRLPGLGNRVERRPPTAGFSGTSPRLLHEISPGYSQVADPRHVVDRSTMRSRRSISTRNAASSRRRRSTTCAA